MSTIGELRRAMTARLPDVLVGARTHHKPRLAALLRQAYPVVTAKAEKPVGDYTVIELGDRTAANQRLARLQAEAACDKRRKQRQQTERLEYQGWAVDAKQRPARIQGGFGGYSWSTPERTEEALRSSLRTRRRKGEARGAGAGVGVASLCLG